LRRVRTVTRFQVDPQFLVPKTGIELGPAALDLVKALLYEERLVRADSNQIITTELILRTYLELQEKLGPGGIPTDPETAEIASAAFAALAPEREAIGARTRSRAASRAAEDVPAAMQLIVLNPELALKDRALRHAISILAQMPHEEAEETLADLRCLVHDEDQGVFGLLFKRGTRFTCRLRHSNPDRLREATDRLVNALAPRAPAEVEDVVRNLESIDRIEKRLVITFETIEMKTPAGELAQIGHVHAVKSQRRLLLYLSFQLPQRYLVYLTVTLIVLDLTLELRFFPGWSVRGLVVRTWLFGNFSRLATGAFGAYLVALFSRFAELRRNLRHAATAGHAGRRLRSSAFGAIVEWRTS